MANYQFIDAYGSVLTANSSVVSGSANRPIISAVVITENTSVLGTGSVNGAASVILMPAPGAGLRNYLTDFAVANTGSVATLVRITAGGASLLGVTIAPATGGSNLIGLRTAIVGPVNSPINFAIDTAASVVYGTAMGYIAP